MVAKHGGNTHVLVSSVDTTVFSGCIELDDVADCFLNLIRSSTLARVSETGSRDSSQHSEALQKIKGAVNALSDMRKNIK